MSSSNLLSRIKIFILDDHAMICEGLSAKLDEYEDIEVLGYDVDPGNALKKIYNVKPDILIVEMQFQGQVSGLDIIKRFRNDIPRMKILVLSELDESLYAERILNLGAHGYLNKKHSTDTVIKALRRIHGGEVFISRGIASQIILGIVTKSSGKSEHSVNDFSDREFEIFILIGNGYKSRAIAEKLNINVKTVETHRHRMKVKLNLKTSEELQRFAVTYMRGIH